MSQDWEYLFLNRLNNEPAVVWPNMDRPQAYIVLHDATDPNNIKEQYWTVVGVYEKHKIAILMSGYFAEVKNDEHRKG